jgi:hypothetical protein
VYQAQIHLAKFITLKKDAAVINQFTNRLSVIVSGDTKEHIDSHHGTDVWRLLADNGFADRKSIGTVGFCRNLEDNKLVVVLPKAYASLEARSSNLAKEKIIHNVYQLIRVFNKISRETAYKKTLIKTNLLVDDLVDSSDPVLDSLEAAIKLRSEYKVHGLYYRKKKSHNFSRDNLPINWGKTLKNCPPQLNGNDIFFNITIHNSRSRSLRHPLSDLHLACMKEIFSLTGDKTYANSLPECSDSEITTILKNPKIYLRNISNDVFDERGQRLKKLITAYLGVGRLRAKDEVQRDDILSYTAEFENIWEYVLRSLFDHSNTGRSLPVGQWFSYPNAAEKKPGITPSIDMQVASGDMNAFIDAKDYRVINGARHGSSSDYYKQVIYRLLTETDASENFFNILVFPGYGQKELFKVYGCHDWSEISNSRVFEIGVDYEIAISRWLGESGTNIQAAITNLLSDLKTFQVKINI